MVNSFSKGTHQGLETEVFSVSHCLCLAQQTFVYQTPVFLSPWKLPSSPLKSHLRLLLILSLALVFLWSPCTCIIKFGFSISLSHVIFLDQPENFRKGRGDFFFLPQYCELNTEMWLPGLTGKKVGGLSMACPSAWLCWWDQRWRAGRGEKPHLTCYQVQAHSARHTTGQWIWEMRCWGKEETVTGELADPEDGRLVPQITILLGSGCQALLQIRGREAMRN